MSRRLQDLTIKDAFMFAAVMSDEKQCRRFLSMVLEMEILEVTVIAEKTIVYHPEYHGIRLDVLAEEKGQRRRFNVEMQVKAEKDLPRRSRYYHAQLDMDSLLSGHSYGELPDTYVIFICDFALSEKPLYRYIYRSMCSETGEQLKDGRTTVFLSTRGTNGDEVPQKLVDFLNYIGNPGKFFNSAQTDDFVSELEKSVKAIKSSRDWEAKFMLLEEMLREEREKGRKEGIEAGRREERERINCLMKMLIEQRRLDDLERSAQDKDYQELLFEEFGM